MPRHISASTTSQTRFVTGEQSDQNRHRPAVDVLFRSAAVTYGSRVIGVVLTGNLDDGALGLGEIKQRGGCAIVQDPEDAYAPSMPRNALEVVEPDYILPLADIGPQLVRMATGSVEQAKIVRFGKVPEDAKRAQYSCPECGGVLQESDSGNGVKFKCRVGHSYAPESLIEDQADHIERELWAAVRSLEEHEQFCIRLARRFQTSQRGKLADRFSERAVASRENAANLRQLLDRAETVRREAQEKQDFTGTEA